MKILVVDDSRAMRSYVRGALGGAFSCELVEAVSGFEALRLLPRERFDLVITDINMPDINGLELVRFVRTSTKHSHVPVLIISTQASARDRKKLKDIGADGFLAKPFEPEELVESVRRLIEAPGSGENGLDEDG